MNEQRKKDAYLSRWAFEWLEKAFQERVAFLIFLKVPSYFGSLHGDPRFDDLVKRIGIPD